MGKRKVYNPGTIVSNYTFDVLCDILDDTVLFLQKKIEKEHSSITQTRKNYASQLKNQMVEKDYITVEQCKVITAQIQSHDLSDFYLACMCLKQVINGKKIQKNQVQYAKNQVLH